MLTDKLAKTVLNLDKILASSKPEKEMVTTVEKYGLQPALVREILSRNEVGVLVSTAELGGKLVDEIYKDFVVSPESLGAFVSAANLDERLVNSLSDIVSGCDLERQLIDKLVENISLDLEKCTELLPECELWDDFVEKLIDLIYEKNTAKQLLSEFELWDDFLEKLIKNFSLEKLKQLVIDCGVEDKLAKVILERVNRPVERVVERVVYARRPHPTQATQSTQTAQTTQVGSA